MPQFPNICARAACVLADERFALRFPNSGSPKRAWPPSPDAPPTPSRPCRCAHPRCRFHVGVQPAVYSQLYIR
eukprot:6174750-Pleurochrysis_carterae.AAC.1